MDIFRSLFVMTLLLVAFTAGAADGLVTVKSPYSAKETMARLESIVKDRELKVFAKIDHAAGATTIGKTLRPTELLIFGHPKGGTPLIECAQTTGIDLPLKALVWEDAGAQVWIAYNDPLYLAQRHGVATCPVAEKLAKALADIVAAVIAPKP